MFDIDFSTLSDEQLLSLAKTKIGAGIPDWETAIWNFLLAWIENPDKGIEVFSSGSTGPAKRIVHSKQAMLNSARMTCEALALKPGGTAFLCLPATKISGMMMIVRCIENKMKLYCVQPTLSPLSAITDEMQIDFASFTPAQFYEVVQNHKIFERAQSIAKIILGGEEVRGVMKDKMRTMQNEIYSTFGMTETISHIALKRLNGVGADTYYKVLPGVSILSGEDGCLIIEAPQLGQPHLQTNDIVKIIEPGKFEWLGRKDNVINSGGIKINPEEMEGQLAAHINMPFFIGGIADDRLGEKLVLVVEGKELRTEELSALKTVLLQLDKTHRPKELIFIPVFARTETGKIKRKESLEKKEFKRIEL